VAWGREHPHLCARYERARQPQIESHRSSAIEPARPSTGGRPFRAAGLGQTPLARSRAIGVMPCRDDHDDLGPMARAGGDLARTLE